MTTLSVPDMSCGHCRKAIEDAVKALDSTAEVSFDMEGRKVSLQSNAALEDVLEALEEEGFPASLAA